MTADSVLTTVATGLERGRVVAVGRRYGEERWLVPIEGRITAAPTVADGTAYVPDWRGRVHAIAVPTGDRRWRHAVSVEGDRATLATTAAVADGRVFVGSLSGWTGVAALDVDDGTVQWTRSTESVTGGPVVAGERVLVRMHSLVVALDRTTGERRWTANRPTGGASGLAADGQRTYLPIRDGLLALSLADGTPDWEWTPSVGASIGTPVVAGEAVLIGAGDRLVAIDRTSGDRLWAVDAAGGESVTPIDGAIYFTDGGALAGLET